MNRNDEYLRRNEICGIAAALRASIILSNARIRKSYNNWPKWLRDQMDSMEQRVEIIFEEMIKYRDGTHGEG